MKKHSLLSHNALRAIVLSCVMAISDAQATGLGKLTVLSARGQQLHAEIELTSLDLGELTKLTANIAPQINFLQAEIEFKPILETFRFTIEPHGSGYVLRITSTQEVNDSYLDFFLELHTSNGKLIREYTFVLEEKSVIQSPQLSPNLRNTTITALIATLNPTTVGKTIVQEANMTKKAAITRRTPLVPTNTSSTPKKDDDGDKGQQYQVKMGDTLMAIARANAENVQLDQLAVSIYLQNESAFDAQNMNRLQAGKVLTIPTSASVRANPVADAHKILEIHSSNFHSYRTKLSETVLTSKPIRSTEPNQNVITGTITTKVLEKPNEVTDAIDLLQLSNVEKKGKTTNFKQSKNQNSAEDVLAKKRTLEATNERLEELEKNISDLGKIMEAKNKSASSTIPTKTTPDEQKIIAVPKISMNVPHVAIAAKSTEVNAKNWLGGLMDWFDMKYLFGVGTSALIFLMIMIIMKRKATTLTKSELSFD